MTNAEIELKYVHHFSGPRGIECDEGWADLINDFIEELDKLPNGKELVFFSIKEKFGILRIDEATFPPGLVATDFYELTTKYEQRSRVTCERCGRAGRVRKGGWMKVLCDEHEKPRT